MTTLPPIAGEVRGVVRDAQHVSIHGDIYYDIVIELEAPGAGAARLRAPSHACAHPPIVGERIVVRLLMQQVVAVEPCGA